MIMIIQIIMIMITIMIIMIIIIIIVLLHPGPSRTSARREPGRRERRSLEGVDINYSIIQYDIYIYIGICIYLSLSIYIYNDIQYNVIVTVRSRGSADRSMAPRGPRDSDKRHGAASLRTRKDIPCHTIQYDTMLYYAMLYYTIIYYARQASSSMQRRSPDEGYVYIHVCVYIYMKCIWYVPIHIYIYIYNLYIGRGGPAGGSNRGGSRRARGETYAIYW